MKKNSICPRFAIISAIASIILLLVTVSCEKEDELTQEIRKAKISGYIQKGPYVNGTQILMVELSPVMKQTGKMFATQISNNHGAFEINDITLTSNFVELSASGYYFDEVKGELSSSPLNLFTLTDIKDKTSINVNLLTHLEKRRIENLIEHKKQFSEAKKTAQQEILAIFGIEGGSMQNSELLDISVNNDDNAKLLAISVILQGNKSVGELTELLANIANEIHEDGILDNDNLMAELRNSAMELNLEEIRKNLEERYKVLGITASIPDFEKYVHNFLKHTASSPTGGGAGATNITAASATLNAYVNPNSMSTTVTFEYGTTPEYGNTVTAEQSPVSNSTAVAVSAGIENLVNSTTYHFRVKAENELGIIYGDDATFTTLAALPSLITLEITNITSDSAISGGSITDNGGDEIIERGVVWSTSDTPTIEQNEGITADGNGTGEFVSYLSELEPITTYYVRAYATNSTGTAYGSEMQFTTPATKKRFAGGHGTDKEPYLIETAEQLDSVRFFASSHFKQIADIDLFNFHPDFGWIPIGNQSTKVFEGVFDGNGFKITNLTINLPEKDHVGLFGQTHNATLENITLETINVHGRISVGGLAGAIENSNVYNCYVSGNITEEWFSIGGLVGTNYGEIKNSHAILDGSVGSNSGGLVGTNYGEIKNSHAILDGSVGSNSGGLVGSNYGNIFNSYATINVSMGDRSGGLVGKNFGNISTSYAIGDITSGHYVGGLIGQNESGNITDCYAKVNIKGDTHIGGLIGYHESGDISHCFAAGIISGNSNSGGLVGTNFLGNVNFSYYNTETSGQNDTGKGSPKTTEELMQQSTFENWDFTTIWNIDEGNSYPILRWQK